MLQCRSPLSFMRQLHRARRSRPPQYGAALGRWRRGKDGPHAAETAAVRHRVSGGAWQCAGPGGGNGPGVRGGRRRPAEPPSRGGSVAVCRRQDRRGTPKRQRYPLRPGTLLLLEPQETHDIQNTGREVLRTLNGDVPPAYTARGRPCHRTNRKPGAGLDGPGTAGAPGQNRR
jgi:hypothetical protein